MSRVERSRTLLFRVYRWVGIWIGLWGITALACTISGVSNNATPDVAPANTFAVPVSWREVATDGWVAFQSQDVQIAAPPNTWTQVPNDLFEGQDILNQKVSEDVTVANVFRYLLPLAVNPEYRLVLLKNDGTAWIYITMVELPIDENGTVNVNNEEIANLGRMRLVDQGIVAEPRNQRPVQLPLGKALRWELIYSPRNSTRALDHQLQYLIPYGEQLYILTFNTQISDFPTYAPVFEAMAETFWIVEYRVSE